MTWDLDIIFPGGSASKEFSAFIDQLEADIESFANDVQNLRAAQNSGNTDISGIAKAVLFMQDISSRSREAGAFVSCLTAQDVHDTGAKLLSSRLSGIRASFSASLTVYNDVLSKLDETNFSNLLKQPQIGELEFALRERIRRSADLLPSEQESLIAALSVDGYVAWGDLYNVIVGRMTAEIEVNGRKETVSMGQLANRLASADDASRSKLFDQWETSWANEAELCAQALNHLSGHRLAVYKARGWKSVLKEPLDVNRMSQATLDAMWGVISNSKAPFVEFLQAKARMLGKEQLRWEDVDAPLGETTSSMSYEEARDFIVRHFNRFSPEMAEFANQCFEKRWIEAEDRPGKRPGGFCTSFPVSEQTRIFVTFSGTPGNVATLAHELGHAYHQHVMRPLPQLVSNYAMNVAETASTFAEAIVSDASIQEASSDAERLILLEDKVGRSIAMLMNIHARFLFETRFYEARKKGVLSVDELNALMSEAQREAYAGALASTHPHFWASKLHFYITGTPFYNFPYTFGYLFSSGIYARAISEGPTFAEKYVKLLQDTGRSQVEDLAAKHLGVDLTKPDFWQQAVDLAAADAREFVRLANASQAQSK
nr:M3 family oligoendopeptidase [Alicyclobacillus acidiphilus]